MENDASEASPLRGKEMRRGPVRRLGTGAIGAAALIAMLAGAVGASRHPPTRSSGNGSPYRRWLRSPNKPRPSR